MDETITVFIDILADEQTCKKIKSFAIYCINKISDYMNEKTIENPRRLLNDKIRSAAAFKGNDWDLLHEL